MGVTEALFLPLLAESARPLITQYDDADGSRVELSRATAANWAAKTANWLRDECDVEPGDPVSVRLPAHWQTVGVLLGAWWAGAHLVTELADASVAFVTPGETAPGAALTAVVALDPFGRGLPTEPTDGSLDYLNDIRAHGDDFRPYQQLPGTAPALAGLTVDDVINQARARAIPANARVLSTNEWSIPDGVIDNLLSILAAGASLVQCAHPDPNRLAARADAEHTTLTL